MSKLAEELQKILKKGNIKNRERIVKSDGMAYQFIIPVKKNKKGE